LGANGSTGQRVPQRLLSYGRQCLDEADRAAVLEALESDWLTQGPAVEAFEQALARRFGAKHALVCANGTAALHLAALALGWQPGEVVIVPAITFVASANCAAYVGAEPYFVDVDPQTLAIDPNEVERAVVQLRAAGRVVKAVVGVDMAGHPADWTALRALADRYELQLVDDACHAMGATYAAGVQIGDCTHQNVATFSFHPVKHITTGEGGAVLTNDDQLADQVAMMRSHGIRRGEAHVPRWEGPWHLEMTELGYNYRISDLQCALGLSQLRKLDTFLARRRTIAGWYGTLLAGTGEFALPSEKRDVRHAYHLYVLRAKFADAKAGRKAFFQRCHARGIALQVHYRPVPLNTFYRTRVSADTLERIPHAMRYYAECFSVPIFPELTQDDVAYVAETLASAYREGRSHA
jgi:perosamine synthetase